MNVTTVIILISAAIAALILRHWTKALCQRFTKTVVVWDHQAALHFRHGRLVGELEAGKHRFWGTGHECVVEDKRFREMVVVGQELITADSGTVKLTAVARWRVADPVRYFRAAEDVTQELYTSIQLALRRIIGGLELDAIVERKAGFGAELLSAVRGESEEAFGIDVAQIDLRDLMLGGELKAAYASALTARLEAKAKVEQARGEAAALRARGNAARQFEDHPELARLLYLETLREMGTAYGNTFVMGVSEDFGWLAKREP